MRWVVLVLAGCRVNFDPSTFDTCDITNELGVPTFRWSENDHCYSFHSTAVGAAQAGTACGTIDGHRVTFGSRDELEAVRAALAPSVPAWIGGINLGGGEGFQWVTGEPALYGNWVAGQPSGGDAAVMDTDGLWYMQPGGTHAYICERSVVVTSDRVYTLLAASRDWTQARDRCELSGAHLATITSASESFTVAPLVASPRWLGAEASAGTTDFRWITGEAFAYDEWENTQPDDPAENCLQADLGGWNNDDCDSSLSAICEYE